MSVVMKRLSISWPKLRIDGGVVLTVDLALSLSFFPVDTDSYAWTVLVKSVTAKTALTACLVAHTPSLVLFSSASA